MRERIYAWCFYQRYHAGSVPLWKRRLADWIWRNLERI